MELTLHIPDFNNPFNIFLAYLVLCYIVTGFLSRISNIKDGGELVLQIYVFAFSPIFLPVGLLMELLILVFRLVSGKKLNGVIKEIYFNENHFGKS